MKTSILKKPLCPVLTAIAIGILLGHFTRNWARK